ncbi:MAG TPA: hypothetical protein VII32_10935 [Thermoanaerobaculia bacterium]|jgi:hypothetical protein
MAAFLFIIAVLIASIAITAGGIALIRRDRDRIRGSGSLGHAMQELEGLFVESKAHVIEADRAEAAEEKEVAGDE